jgi:hypothetical protein
VEVGRYRKARVVASSGVFLAGVWGGAMSLFTDAESVASGDVTTGSVAIGVTPVSTSLAVANMAPGDTVTAPVTVRNDGTLDLRYAMSSVSGGDAGLAGALAVTVKSGVTDCTNAGFAGSGASVVSGTLAAVSIGSSTAGAQAGDRTLSPGGSEVLCFQVALPTSAANTLQGKTAGATFTFSAEQTANNP